MKKTLRILFTLVFLLTSIFGGMASNSSAVGQHDYGDYPYGTKVETFRGDLRPTGLGNPDEREAIAHWHTSEFQNIIANTPPANLLNGVQFDLLPDPSKGDGEWDLSGKEGYYVVPLQPGIIKDIATRANGNPDWVYQQMVNLPQAKKYLVNGQTYVPFGEIVAASGGGSPQRQRIAEEGDPRGGIDNILFHTIWKITQMPDIQEIWFNNTLVVSNNTILNSNYIVPAGQMLTVRVKRSTYGVNPTINNVKVYMDGFLEPGIGHYLDAKANTNTGEYTFTISNPEKLQAGTMHEIKFEVWDSFQRERHLTLKYTAQGLNCDPSTSSTRATLKIAGEPDESLATNQEYELPQGKNTISLTFPKAGTLKVNGVPFGGTSTSFTNIVIAGNTAISYQSSDNTECWIQEFVPTTAPPPECDPETSALKLTVDMWGSDSDHTSDLASGGSYTLKQDVDFLQFRSPVKGTFYMNGSPAASSTTVFTLDHAGPHMEPLTISFESEDKSQCWSKTFRWGSSKPVISCPDVYIDSPSGRSKVNNGQTLYAVKNGNMELFAWYQNDGKEFGASTYWKIKRPDGYVVSYKGWDPNGEGSHSLYPADKLTIPYHSSYEEYRVVFSQVGTYEIWLEFPNNEIGREWQEKGCSWKIHVVVTETIICDMVSFSVKMDGKAANFSGGQGTMSSPYQLKLPTANTVLQMDLLYQGIKGNVYADFDLYDKNGQFMDLRHNANEYYVDFQYYNTAPAPYLLTVQLKGNPDCIKYIEITVDPFSCDNVSFTPSIDGQTATFKGGDGSQANPYVLDVLADGSQDVSIQALYAGNPSVITADWELKKNGSTLRTVVGKNPFTHTFTDTANATYTLKVTVKMGTSTCVQYITIQVKMLSCDMVEIQPFFGGFLTTMTGEGSSSNPYVVEVPVGTGQESMFRALFNGKADGVTADWTLKKDSFSGATVDSKKGINDYRYTFTGSTGTTFYLIAEVDAGNLDCTKYIKIQLVGKICTGIYLHLLYEIEGHPAVIKLDQAGKTVTIQANSVKRIAVMLGETPDDIYGSTVSAEWTGTRPNEEDVLPDLIYHISNVSAGTYTVHAKVDDFGNPQWTGCEFTVTIVVSETAQPEPEPCTTCEPGGPVDGGKMKIRIYDSSNRLLVSTSDGVWEREPAKVEVTIDQTSIHSAFASIDQQISQAVEAKVTELQGRYSAPEYENVSISVSPPEWDSRNNPLTKWPSDLTLTVSGPGADQTFTLDPQRQTQSHVYNGATVPTLTTWNLPLHAEDYQAKVNDFHIDVPYQIAFTVSYLQCRMEPQPSPDDDPETGEPLPPPPDEKVCEPGTESTSISNQYRITVIGDETRFETYEPNARGILAHTAEWSEYHARDRYQNSGPDDFYAGERILVRVQLEARHKHPFSGQFPRINSATAWIAETGRQSTPLQSTLSLIPESPVHWTGPSHTVDKLGVRELGVDTPIMGDKQKGFQKDASYAVYFTVQFAFGVHKGFAYPNKTVGSGHDRSDYRSGFTIIANAWERQGIRNHTLH